MAMAACGSLQHMFENPVPENPTLLESLSSSWNQIKASPIDQSSFTEIFGELHFKQNSQSVTSASSSFPISSFSSNSIFKLSVNGSFIENYDEKNNISSSPSSPSSSKFFSSTQKIESFSLKSESLQLCTEGLGFESSDDVEEMKEDWERKGMKANSSINNTAKHATKTENLYSEFKKSRSSSSFGGFPPPISCIGKSGKPWVCFKSYREDGRFVLKEVRIPTQEFLHACREDGRLKLQFLQPNDDEVLEEEEEDDEVEELEEEFINGDIDKIEKKRQT